MIGMSAAAVGDGDLMAVLHFDGESSIKTSARAQVSSQLLMHGWYTGELKHSPEEW
jgi:hypothetical protein